MTATVAVTGGNGRVGRAVLAGLNESGYSTVDLARGKRREDVSDSYITTNLLNAGEVYGSVAKSDADAIVHLGMLPTPEMTPGYRTYESNVMSSYHLLEAAGELGVDTVALASSFSALGGGYEPDPPAIDYLPVDENHRLTPSNPYGLGKQTLEIAADSFARRHGDRPQTITSLRFPWVVDDEMARETFVEADRTLAGMRESDAFHSQRNTLFSYVHTSDVIDLVRRVVEADFDGHERIWLSAPDTSAEIPTRIIVEELFPDAAVRDAFAEKSHASLVDTTKAEELFNWEPEWSWRDLV